jgi:4-hydroxy-3-methylbut-2-en-1-yl diphosphate synthase IspG/GcpE
MADPLAGSHPILEAAYFIDAPDVNRAYVVGATATGAEVSGNASAAADLAMVGERLEVKHDTAIPTATVATAVAAALLSAARLDSKRGRIVIPPHCGLELWDVLSIVDAVANQNTTYRVIGYTFEYDTRQGTCLHTLDLCAP